MKWKMSPLPLFSFLKILPEAECAGQARVNPGLAVRACVRACVRVCVCVCMWVGGGRLSGSWLRVVFITHLVQTFVPSTASAGSF